MAELTNLTDRISHLRDRKGSPMATPPSTTPPKEPAPKKRKARKGSKGSSERRFATDYFMIFVYALLGVAVCTQFVLIAWLDLI